MFSPHELSTALLLHDRSYQLFRWAKTALNSGGVTFNVAHDRMSAPEAATEWIARCYDNLPVAARPPRDLIPQFANLFTSYFKTSFELRKNPPLVRKTECGCYCQFCSYLGRASQLVVRNPGKEVMKDARELQRIALTRLAEYRQLELPEDRLRSILTDVSIRREVAIVAYANELVRRCTFASQGEGVLVLWREFAWQATPARRNPSVTTSMPIPKFRLTEQMVEDAIGVLSVRIASD